MLDFLPVITPKTHFYPVMLLMNQSVYCCPTPSKTANTCSNIGYSIFVLFQLNIGFNKPAVDLTDKQDTACSLANDLLMMTSC